VIECPSQGTSVVVLTRARIRIKRSVIEGIRAPVNSMAAGLILEIGLRFVLRFLGYLCAFRVP
jgi:hypothetical protein